MTDSRFNGPAWFAIPFHCRPGLVRYVCDHYPTGSFLAAVISNDLMDAAFRADGDNIAAFRYYALWLKQHAPPASYGSREKYKAWIRKEDTKDAQPG